MYQLIEFEDSSGGGLSVVCTKWLTPRKAEVFWPPYKDIKKYNRAVKQGELVDENTWSLYKIKRSFYTCDDFEKIHEKLKEAQDTSDIQSEIENNPKRRRIKPRKVYSSDSEDEIETLSRPPKILRLLTNRKNPNLKSPVKSQTIANNDCVIDQTSSLLPKTPSSLATSLELEEFQKKILATLTHIKEQNDLIIGLLDTKVSTNSTLPSDFPVELPIKNGEDLKLIEGYINNKRQNFSYLVAFLTTLGGKDHITKTNRILKHLVTDEFAKNYNFHGHRQKRAFNVLKIQAAIVEAVLSTCSTTRKDIEDCVKVYLKHAPQRLTRKASKPII